MLVKHMNCTSLYLANVCPYTCSFIQALDLSTCKANESICAEMGKNKLDYSCNIIKAI